MDNIKLKKLGKYFTKGLQAGILASALIAGNVSCSQPAGGNSYEYGTENGDDEEQTAKPPVKPDPDPTKPTEPVTPTDPDEGKDDDKNEQKYPDYYIDEDFGGQKFVEYGRADHYSNDEFTTCYNNAKKFLQDKVDDLQNDIKGQTNSYYKMIDTALQRYNKQQTIGNNIDANYDAFGSLFNALTNEEILSDAEYFDYRVSYYKLAYNAYQNSLSNVVENNDSGASKDMKNTNNSFFVQELANSSYNYTTLTLTKAKEVMNNTLATISQKTKVNSAVLKKVVELVLYNESLYGLNDFAVGQGISTLHHTHTGIAEFFTYGEKVMNYTNNFNNVQNIDDGRTM